MNDNNGNNNNNNFKKNQKPFTLLSFCYYSYLCF